MLSGIFMHGVYIQYYLTRYNTIYISPRDYSPTSVPYFRTPLAIQNSVHIRYLDHQFILIFIYGAYKRILYILQMLPSSN